MRLINIILIFLNNMAKAKVKKITIKKNKVSKPKGTKAPKGMSKYKPIGKIKFPIGKKVPKKNYAL